MSDDASPQPQDAKGPEDVDAKVATGYAVYDVDLERFVGPVHRPATTAGKSAAQDYADGREDGHSYQVRRV